MIKISIELWPGGDSSKKKEICKGMIANDGTGNHEIGNYVYSIHTTQRNIKGRIIKHKRNQDVLELIRKILAKNTQVDGVFIKKETSMK